MTAHIEIATEKVKDFCQKWKITELSLFGSVLRDDFCPESDVDVLVRFDANNEKTLFDLVEMREELKDLFGREVDLVQEEGLVNPYRRRSILSSRKSYMQPKERDAGCLWDILTAARLIQVVVNKMDQQTFLKDPIHQAAVVRQYEIIGEATKRLSEPLRHSYPNIPWKKMAGMRDILIHSYDRVNLYDVWNTSTTAIPDLIASIEPLLPPLDTPDV